jgi:hypothetical protein
MDHNSQDISENDNSDWKIKSTKKQQKKKTKENPFSRNFHRLPEYKPKTRRKIF